jgi:hypothetical protein
MIYHANKPETVRSIYCTVHMYEVPFFERSWENKLMRNIVVVYLLASICMIINLLPVLSLRRQSVLSISIAAASKRLNKVPGQNRSQFLSMSSSSIKEVIDKSLSDNNVMVFSKSYCPYCTKTKSTLESLKIPFGVIELDVCTL